MRTSGKILSEITADEMISSFIFVITSTLLKRFKLPQKDVIKK